MSNGLKLLNIKFEKAVRFLTEYMPPSDEESRKPVIFHDIRVGVYLYENGYSEDIVIAGVLHDMVEWSGIEKEIIKDEFGENVFKLILANTKNDSIPDKFEKTADILDSFKWYSNQNNEDQLRYCLRNADAIMRLKPNDFNDRIFDELEN